MRDDTAHTFRRLQQDFEQLKKAAAAVGLELTIQLSRDGRLIMYRPSKHLECETFDMIAAYLDGYANGRKSK